MIPAKPRPRTELATRPQSASRGTASTREAVPKDTAFAAHVRNTLHWLNMNLLVLERQTTIRYWVQEFYNISFSLHPSFCWMRQYLLRELHILRLELCDRRIVPGDRLQVPRQHLSDAPGLQHVHHLRSVNVVDCCRWVTFMTRNEHFSSKLPRCINGANYFSFYVSVWPKNL